MHKIIPNGPVLVMLIGPSGGGKSTLAEAHFPKQEVVSSDGIRAEFTGRIARQDKNDDVFKEFHRRIEARLLAGCRAVADATHLHLKDRRATAEIARNWKLPVIYLVMNRDMIAKTQRAGWREAQHIGDKSLIQAHEDTFVANEKQILAGDPTGRGYRLADLVVDARRDTFRVATGLPRVRDKVLPHLAEHKFTGIRVIGDVHGNLQGLLRAVDGAKEKRRFLLFLGDIVDYGVHTLDTAVLVQDLVAKDYAANLRGNHEKKIRRFVEQERKTGFLGRETHGNNVTMNQLKALDPDSRLLWEQRFLALVDQSPDHIVIGNYLFVHAAALPDMWDNPIFRFPRNTMLESFALYGETDGTKGSDGFPTRLYTWINRVEAGRTVVVGHAVRSVDEPLVVPGELGGKAVFLDTGSSKEVGGRPGHLSWWDLDIVETKKDGFRLVPVEFGRE